MPTYFPSYVFTGIRPFREIELRKDWDAITQSYEYEDGGKDFNEISDSAPIRWEYVVQIVSQPGHEGVVAARDAANVYHNFYDSVRLSNAFYFVDKFGTTWTDVHIESYDRQHTDNKSWVVMCSFRLVSFTSNYIDITAPCAPIILSGSTIDSGTVSLTIYEPDDDCTEVPPTDDDYLLLL